MRRRRLQATFVVAVAVCGDPVMGLWCDRCLLPSRYAVVVLLNGVPAVVGSCVHPHGDG